jgi:malate dehydrogenase
LKRTRITVIGAGNVGATTAHRLAEGQLGDVVLVDVVEGMPQGKALDLAQAAPVVHHDCIVAGANDYDATADSDIIVVTAGFARRPGMSRDDLRDANARIVAACIQRACKVSRESTVIMVTNPLDVMCEVARRVSGFPRERIVGMAGVLDTARLRAFLAKEMNVSTESVSALVLGGHGDSMVALPRFTTVSGVPVTELLAKERIDAIVERTAQGGGEIASPDRLGVLRTGGRRLRDGRLDRQGPQEDPAVLGLPAGRVRPVRRLGRGAVPPRPGGHGRRVRDQADGRRAGAARQECG